MFQTYFVYGTGKFEHPVREPHADRAAASAHVLRCTAQLTPAESADGDHYFYREERTVPSSTRTDDVYVIVVAMPGYLPESEPYAVRGVDMAYDCARHELSDEDPMPYSRDEFWSALTIGGGASIPLESGYTIEVTPLDSLGLPAENIADYLADIT